MVAAKEPTTKEYIVELLDELPLEALAEVATFVEYQRYRMQQQRTQQSESDQIVPVSIEGLSSGVNITEEEIAELRQEMWGRLVDRFN